MNNASKQEHFEEKRKYPRLKISLPIKVYYQGKDFIVACIHDISPDGMQVRCSEENAQVLKNEKIVSVIVNFCLPSSGKEIMVKSEICYLDLSKHNSVREAVCGLKFLQFTGDSKKQLGYFIYNEMES